MVTRSALVIILGSPASGKTRLGARLAADLGVACHGKDEVKEALFDTLGVGERDWSSRLSRASCAVLLRIGLTTAAAGLPCMLEGNWRPEHRSALQALTQERALPLAQVCCYADAPEIHRRFHARRRHPGHSDRLLWDEIAASLPLKPDFLALPGPRWPYRADQADDYAELRRNLEIWLERRQSRSKSNF